MSFIAFIIWSILYSAPMLYLLTRDVSDDIYQIFQKNFEKTVVIGIILAVMGYALTSSTLYQLGLLFWINSAILWLIGDTILKKEK